MKVLGANGLQYLITKLMGVDFIVEEGTSGIWTYRKWNSGIAECWGNDNTHTTSSTAGDTTNIAISIPSGLFVAKPVAVVSQGTAGTVDSRVNYVNVSGSGTSYSIDCWVYSALASRAVNLAMHISGRWK